MHESVAPLLRDWETFYVIVGSSAAALTGLQFVVLTLIAQIGAVRGREESIAAFGSPNVVHFCAALLVGAILSAPWHSAAQVSIPVAACGLAGVLYSASVLRMARRQRTYQPVAEDWIWHTILPFLAYSTLFAAGIVLGRHPAGVLFVVAGAELLLVFIGIHNAWDTVIYITVQQGARQEAGAGAPGAREPHADSVVPDSAPAGAPSSVRSPRA